MTLYWILMLTMNLLPCLAHPVSHRTFSDIYRLISNLQQIECNEQNSTFYIPSGTDGCIEKSLNCSAKELNVVAAECFDSGTSEYSQVFRTRDRIVQLLDNNVNDIENDQQCECEREQKSYKEFFENLLVQIQMLNSKSEPKNSRSTLTQASK